MTMLYNYGRKVSPDTILGATMAKCIIAQENALRTSHEVRQAFHAGDYGAAIEWQEIARADHVAVWVRLDQIIGV